VLPGKQVPVTFELEAAVPNPFNPSTTISYALPKPTEVNFSIFDITGRLISTLRNADQPAGHYSLRWDGRDDSGVLVSTGVYLGRMQAGAYSQTIKMVFLR
jgi:flagellar hook assembly protein FlgD